MNFRAEREWITSELAKRPYSEDKLVLFSYINKLFDALEKPCEPEYRYKYSNYEHEDKPKEQEYCKCDYEQPLVFDGYGKWECPSCHKPRTKELEPKPNEWCECEIGRFILVCETCHKAKKPEIKPKPREWKGGDIIGDKFMPLWIYAGLAWTNIYKGHQVDSSVKIDGAYYFGNILSSGEDRYDSTRPREIT